MTAKGTEHEFGDKPGSRRSIFQRDRQWLLLVMTVTGYSVPKVVITLYGHPTTAAGGRAAVHLETEDEVPDVERIQLRMKAVLFLEISLALPR